MRSTLAAALLGLLAVGVSGRKVVIVSLPGLSKEHLDTPPNGVELPGFAALQAAGARATGGVKEADGLSHGAYAAGHTLATGQSAGATGMYADEMYDAAADQTFVRGTVHPGKPGTAAGMAMGAADVERWYHGEPVWQTAAAQGVATEGGWAKTSAGRTLSTSDVTAVLAKLAEAKTNPRQHTLVMVTDTALVDEVAKGALSTARLEAVLKQWDAELLRLWNALKAGKEADGEGGDLVVVSTSGAAAVAGTVAGVTGAQTSESYPRVFVDTADRAAVLAGLQGSTMNGDVSRLVDTSNAALMTQLGLAGPYQQRLGAVAAWAAGGKVFGSATITAWQAGVFLAAGQSFRQGRMFNGAVAAADVYLLACRLVQVVPPAGVVGSLKVLEMQALGRSPTRAHFIGSKKYRLSQDELVVMPPTESEFVVGVRFDMELQVPKALPGVDLTRMGWMLTRDGAAAQLGCLPNNEVVFEAASATSTHMRHVARQCELADPGVYVLTLMSGSRVQKVMWRARTLPGAGAKNVILFVGDGMSVPMVTGTRLLRRGARLPTDNFEVVGTSFVHALGSLVTDSAASASSLNSGHKAVAGMTGIYPDGTEYQEATDEATYDTDNAHVELASEYFRRKYQAKIGVVSTASVLDATPAGVFAHYEDRSKSTQLALQALEAQPEVLLGGGVEVFRGEKWVQHRTPGEPRNLLDDAKAKGYTVAGTTAEMQAAAGTADKLLGLFSESHMPTWVDRVGSDQHPSLPQMAEAAITVLTRNANDRFYLMVEAASIDKQAHANDHVRMLGDSLELQATVNRTIELLKAKSLLDDTLIVVTSDHATGGYDIFGTVNTDSNPDVTTADIEVYGNAEWADYVTDASGFHVVNWDDAQWGFAQLNNHHPAYNESFKRKPAQGWLSDQARREELRGLTLAKTIEGTSSVHTASDVLVYAHGKGASYFQGGHDQTNVFFGIMNAMAPAPAVTLAPEQQQLVELQQKVEQLEKQNEELRVAQQQSKQLAELKAEVEKQVRSECNRDNVSDGETALLVLVSLALVATVAVVVMLLRKPTMMPFGNAPDASA